MFALLSARSSRATLVFSSALVLSGSFFSPGLAYSQQTARYLQSGVGTEDRITDLLAHMTLQEKVEALGTNPSFPRLGVLGTGHVEGLHGLALGGPGGWEGKGQPVVPTTQFPQARGLGQTWDPVLIQQVATLEGQEVRYAYNKYHRGGLVVRAPNADLSRDPRWGRSEESYGEDPFLVGTLATAFTRGLQGPDPRYWQSASLLKHFLANSNEDLRDSSSSNFDTRLFHEYYSVPFRMAIEDGHADAMMTSYNSWNNVPMTANPVLRNVVFKTWGFDGILCTDAGALTNMVKASHTYATLPEAAAAAIHAGINQFLDDYKKPVQDALDQHLITADDLDRNLRGVFRVMIHLGLLDPTAAQPYTHPGVLETVFQPDPWNLPTSRELVRKATLESIVLLKNEHAALPLDPARLSSIAVIGPLADHVALDWYSGTPPFTVTPLAGIRARLGKTATVTVSTSGDPAEAAALAGKAQVAVVIVGNEPTCGAGWMKCALPSSGKEAIDRKSLTLEQEELVKAAFAANPNTIVVLQTSFPYTTTWTQEHVPAILEMTHNSEEQGTALAAILFGDSNPAGRLSQTWPAALEQLPPMMDYDLRHGRTYLYATAKPLYAFGYGLSYTSFSYRNLKLSSPTLSSTGELQFSIDVTNTGTRDGDEVVQVYVSYPHSDVPRPLEELKAFARVTIPAGKIRTVPLRIAAKSLAYWNDKTNSFIVEPGSVQLRVGSSSDTIQLRQNFNVVR